MNQRATSLHDPRQQQAGAHNQDHETLEEKSQRLKARLIQHAAERERAAVLFSAESERDPAKKDDNNVRGRQGGPGQLDISALPALSPDREEYLSRNLSSLLRHRAQKEGLPIDGQGWVPLDAVQNFMNRRAKRRVEEIEFRIAVRDNAKKRFAIREGPPCMIRANQGHTLRGIDPDLVEVDVEAVRFAIHCTYYVPWLQIKVSGLNRMDRNHIHFVQHHPGEAVRSGFRGNCEVLIWVDMVKAKAKGIRFFKSENGVILSEGLDGVISTEFFSMVESKAGRLMDWSNKGPETPEQRPPPNNWRNKCGASSSPWHDMRGDATGAQDSSGSTGAPGSGHQSLSSVPSTQGREYAEKIRYAQGYQGSGSSSSVTPDQCWSDGRWSAQQWADYYNREHSGK